MSQAFKPSKELVFSSVEKDRQRLILFCEKQSSEKLILDLEEVRLCDSAGLAFLIEAKRLAKSYNKFCELKGINKQIMALASFCSVSDLLIES